MNSNYHIEQLLEQKESLWLEFKRQWYWNNDETDTSSGWTEFVIDFSALFNTYYDNGNPVEIIRYLIIGFDEETKKCRDYDLDGNNNKLDILSDLNAFKRKIDSKLKKYFRNVPSYNNLQDLNDVGSFYKIVEVKIRNSKMLIFQIPSAPYLLELKKDLTNVKENSLFCRRLKNKSKKEPENIVASVDITQYLKDSVEKVYKEKFSSYPKKDTSIKKIIEAYQNNNFPNSELHEIVLKRNYSEGYFFEIFALHYKVTRSIKKICFTYISKYTSQSKTVEHIVDEGYLSKGDVNIVLTDKYNKSGGEIDINHIKLLFEEKEYSIDIYNIEDFMQAELYGNKFDADIFHQGNFNITNFVNPYTESSDEKTAELILGEWFNSTNSPILVMKGMGGIGKTTVIKHFLDELYRSKSINILFINSHDLISDIMKKSKTETIFDFYKIMVEQTEIEINNQFDEKLLELSIDNGSLIIAIDGIDEVIARVGNKFDLNKFINSIYVNYSGGFERAKILITCRDYFWDKTGKNYDIYDIEEVSLKPFNRDMTEKYFSMSLGPSSETKVKKSLQLADEFAKPDNNQEIYIPYILDMIKDDLLIESKTRKIKTEILQTEVDLNDYLVGKVCEREKIKLDNLAVDKQIEFLSTLALFHNGIIHDDQLDSLKSELYKIALKDEQIEKFKDHPLLIFNQGNKSLSFRFDFFVEYFKMIGIITFLKRNNFLDIDFHILDTIMQYIAYDNSFTKGIKQRIDNDSCFRVIDSIECFLKKHLDKLPEKYRSLEHKKRLISSFFILSIVLSGYQTTEERTDLMELFFADEDKPKKIKGLCLMNLHSNDNSDNRKILFNFEGFQFDDCEFANYEYFAHCKFDNNTYFTNTKFVAPLRSHGIKCNINKEHIDTTSCMTEGIIDIIDENQKVNDEKDSNLRNEVKIIIKYFWAGSSFREKLADDVNKKLQKYHILIKKLKKLNVIKVQTTTTREKRVNDQYYISSDYSDLRKIMEENETCPEFEKIIAMLKDNS